MPLVHDRAICIRKVEYSETSQILTLFSRGHGRVQVIAKGARRRTKAGASKFDGGVDLLDLGEAVFSHSPERKLSPLCEWHQANGHLDLRGNLRALYLAQYAAELVAMLFEENDPHPALFDRLERVIDDLATPQIEEAFLAFQLELLREAGYLPELSACVECGAMLEEGSRAFFSPMRGGAICRNCEGLVPDRIEIDVRLLRLTTSLFGPARLPRLTRHQTDPINRFLAQHVEHTLGRRLRMSRWVLFSAAPADAQSVATTCGRARHAYNRRP